MELSKQERTLALNEVILYLFKQERTLALN